jgi:hypothetical protein
MVVGIYARPKVITKINFNAIAILHTVAFTMARSQSQSVMSSPVFW